MGEDLYYWKEIYLIRIAEVRYDWGFYSIKKSRSKVRLKIYFIEEVKIRYGLGLIHGKGQSKARLEICFIEHEKFRYGCKFISLKMLKYFTAEDLFHSKCWNTLKLRIYSI